MKKKGMSLGISLMLATVIVLGGLELLVKSLPLDFYNKQNPITPPTPSSISSGSSTANHPAAPGHGQILISPYHNRLTDSERGQVLAHMERTCRFWSEQAGSSASGEYERTMRAMACRRAQNYGRENGMSVSVPRVPRTVIQHVPTSVIRKAPTVSFIDCDTLGRGSLKARQCRSKVKHLLVGKCKQWGVTVDKSRGETREVAASQRDAWCEASRKYAIVIP